MEIICFLLNITEYRIAFLSACFQKGLVSFYKVYKYSAHWGYNDLGERLWKLFPENLGSNPSFSTYHLKLKNVRGEKDSLSTNASLCGRNIRQ